MSDVVTPCSPEPPNAYRCDRYAVKPNDSLAVGLGPCVCRPTLVHELAAGLNAKSSLLNSVHSPAPNPAKKVTPTGRA